MYALLIVLHYITLLISYCKLCNVSAFHSYEVPLFKQISNYFDNKKCYYKTNDKDTKHRLFTNRAFPCITNNNNSTSPKAQTLNFKISPILTLFPLHPKQFPLILHSFPQSVVDSRITRLCVNQNQRIPNQKLTRIAGYIKYIDIFFTVSFFTYIGYFKHTLISF